MKFQSTPSAREGDSQLAINLQYANVSIHAFREGRRLARFQPVSVSAEVSIHAFREGRRPGRCQKMKKGREFQSTPSAREGDAFLCAQCAELYGVSIHAFREGRRHGNGNDIREVCGFQSTPSAREGDTRRLDV